MSDVGGELFAFFSSSCRSPMPVVVSEITRDNEEGLPDKLLQKNSAYAL